MTVVNFIHSLLLLYHMHDDGMFPFGFTHLNVNIFRSCARSVSLL